MLVQHEKARLQDGYEYDFLVLAALFWGLSGGIGEILIAYSWGRVRGFLLPGCDRTDVRPHLDNTASTKKWPDNSPVIVLVSNRRYRRNG